MKLILKILSSSIGAAVATFAIQLVLSRTLPVIEFGVYATVASGIAIAAQFVVTGIGGLALRRALIDVEAGRHVLRLARISLAVACGIAFILTLSFLGWGEYGFVIPMLATLYFGAAAQAYLQLIAQMSERPSILALSQTCLPFCRLIFALLATVFFDGLLEVCAFLAFANILAMVAYVYIARRVTPFAGEATTGVREGVVPFLVSSFPYSLNGTINVAQVQLIVSLSAVLFGYGVAGNASICNTLLTALYLIPNIVFGIYFLPKYHRASSGSLGAVSPFRNAVLSFLSGIVLAYIAYMASPLIIGRVFSEKYLGAEELFAVFCIGVPFRFYSTALGAALLSERNVGKKVLVNFVALIVQVGLVFLMKQRGESIVAISVVASEIFVAVAFTFTFFRFSDLVKSK